jgi:hypothetical protein
LWNEEIWAPLLIDKFLFYNSHKLTILRNVYMYSVPLHWLKTALQAIRLTHL